MLTNFLIALESICKSIGCSRRLTPPGFKIHLYSIKFPHLTSGFFRFRASSIICLRKSLMVPFVGAASTDRKARRANTAMLFMMCFNSCQGSRWRSGVSGVSLLCCDTKHSSSYSVSAGCPQCWCKLWVFILMWAITNFESSPGINAQLRTENIYSFEPERDVVILLIMCIKQVTFCLAYI